MSKYKIIEQTIYKILYFPTWLGEQTLKMINYSRFRSDGIRDPAQTLVCRDNKPIFNKVLIKKFSNKRLENKNLKSYLINHIQHIGQIVRRGQTVPKGDYRKLKEGKGKSSNAPLGSFKSFLVKRKWMVTGVILLVLLGPAAWLVSRHPQKAEAGWWDDGWMYRQAVAVSNNTSFSGTNVPYRVIIDTATPIAAGKMQADADDIRILDKDGKIVRHQIEQSTLNTTATGLWFEGSITANSAATYYIYYGNSSVGAVGFASDVASAGTGETVEMNDGFGYTTSTAHARISDIRKDGANLGVNGNYHYTTSYPGNWWDDRAFARTLLASGPLFVEVKYEDTSYGSYSSFGTNIKMFANGFAETRVFMNYNTSGSENLYYYLHFDNDTRNSLWVNGSEVLVDQAANSGTLTEASLGDSWFGQRWTVSGNYGGTIVRKNGSDWSSGATSAQASYYQTNYSYAEAYTNGSSREIRYGVFAGNGTSNDMNEKASLLGGYTSSAQTEEQSPGPVAYWKFDEGYGTTPQDTTNNNYDGSFLSAPVWKTEEYCVSGKCLAFDNVDDGVSIANQNFTSLTDYTMSAWINLKGNHQHYTGTIMSSGDWNNTHWAFGINQNNTGIDLRLPDGSTFPATKAYTFPLNQWTYVSITRSGATITYYVDGKSIGTYTGTTGNLISGATNTTIGRETYAGGYFAFNGWVDEPKIYNYARSAAQIKTDFAAAGTAKGAAAVLGTSKDQGDFLSEGLVGYWKMDESSSPSLDSSGNSNTGTWSGSISGVAGKFGKAADVPGTGCGGSAHVINVADSDSLDVGYSTSMTTSFWLKNDSNVCAAILKKSGMWEFYRCTTVITARFDGASPTDYSGSTALSNGQWYFVTITRNYQTGKTVLYLNGERDAEWTISLGAATTSNGVGIGAYYGGGCPIDGQLDEVRLYNRELSPKEVRDLYNWAPGPVGYWNFENDTTSTITDKSGSGLNLSVSGSPTFVTGKYGKAFNINGGSETAVSATTPLLDTDYHTIGFWLRFNQTAPAYWGKFFGYQPGGSDRSPGIWTYPSANCLHWRYDPGNTGPTSCGGPNGESTYFTNNQWYYITGVKNGSTFNFYVNGVLIESGAVVSPKTTGSSTITLGGGSPYVSMDEFKIYNYARTQKQITEDMSARGGSALGGNAAVAYWKFNEGVGNTAYNYGNVGSAINGVLGTGSSAPSWTNQGKFGKALSFDGSNDYVQVLDNSALKPTTNVTVSAWIYPTSNSGQDYKRIVNKAVSDDGGEYTLWMYNSQTIIWYVNSWTSGYIVSNSAVPLNQWSYVTGTYDSGNLKLYINGKIDKTGTTSVTTISPTSNNLYIGNWGNGARPFPGKIDEVKIYNSTLTEDEIKLDYNQGKTAVLGDSVEDNSDNPLGYWKMDETTGNTAYNNGSGAGNAAWSSTGTWVNGQINGAANVSGQYLVHSTTGLTTTNGTVEAWVKPLTGTDNYWGVWQTHDSGSVNWVDWIWLGRYGSTFYFRMGNGSDCCSNDTTFNPTNYFTSDQWTTWKGDADSVADDTMTVYVGGVQVAQRTNVNLQATMDPSARIGFGHTYTADGHMDEVKVYNYARSAAQIKADAATDVLNPSLPGAPIAEWKFDEYSGTAANDTSGNGVNGSFVGSPNWQSAGSCKQGTCLKFDGSSRVDLSSNPQNGATAGSWSFWAKWDIDPTSVYENIYIQESSVWIAHYAGNLGIDISNGSWFDGNGGHSTGAILPLNSFTDLKWHFVEWTFDGNYVRGYLDGQLKVGPISTGTVHSIANGSTPRSIGSRGAAQYLNGKIDGFKIYDYARTPAQIAYDYDRGKPVGEWRFNECQGTTLNDYSGNGNHGSISIGATAPQTSAGTCTDGLSTSAWYNGASGKYNASLNFDGVDDKVLNNNGGFLPNGDNPRTIAFWFKPNSGMSTSNIAFGYGCATEGISCGSSGQGTYVGAWANTSSIGMHLETCQVTGPAVPSPTTGWHLYTAIFNGNNTITYYIDAKNKTTVTPGCTINSSSGNGFSIGVGRWGYYDGQIDEAQVYNYALNGEQVKTLYNQGAAVQFAPLTGTP